MPLHDWSNRPGWDGVHHLWISHLLQFIKPRLPAGYRAYIGSAPVVAVGASADRPDVGVRQWPVNGAGTAGPGATAGIEPDDEIAVATFDTSASLFVERAQRLIAAIELISPRNKDRPSARAAYLGRYAGYLLEGVNLLLVDVHPRPQGFSFADQIATDFQIRQPALAPPLAVSYRVGEPAATGGRLLAIWRRQLAVGAALPELPLSLTVGQGVAVDLESTYMAAAADSYIE